MSYSSFELKYCERCGGLGLRRTHSGTSYCATCDQMMQNFLLRPSRALLRRGPRRAFALQASAEVNYA